MRQASRISLSVLVCSVAIPFAMLFVLIGWPEAEWAWKISLWVLAAQLAAGLAIVLAALFTLALREIWK